MAQATGHGFSKEVYEAIVAIVDDRMREIRVTREDFDDLKAVVRELAEAQKRTEAKVEELAEAQKRTEIKVEELAEAQKRTETKVKELAEAQKRTEARVEELAEAQKRTEAKVGELAEAQAKTEKVVQGLVRDMRSVKKQLGGLSDTVGYGLEDRAIQSLPRILKERLSLEIQVMDRRFLEYPDGGLDEINIYGEGTLDGKAVCIIGESKAQLGKKDVERFRKLLERTHKHLARPLIPLLVVYSVRPEVQQYATEKIPELIIVKSYEL
ncbi:hypothetical protein SAMN02745206_00422 [Desulfacinum infernum DSM 9756]|uniref:Chordopoxvirus fusion protein n=1 Tax=Desulfacinum infernum DSM 9756 TaxID=1121391 RepID=A0A1M4UA34_9BACT|nr:hypothetical protein [Desulfacinum infernum]SHE53518.1 hypothetical protein SAMN02745206_00422 [Desulfacinum infernum DSM 9756]